jgi:hypothetical protein
VDADQISLKRFRQGSAAHAMAVEILSGKRVTRPELAGKHSVSVTSVNRVLKVLEDEGAQITRDVVDREAVFQFVSVVTRPSQARLPGLQQRATIVRSEIFGDSIMLDFVVDDSRYRGQVKSIQSVPPLGSTIQVTGISLVDDHTADVVLTPSTDQTRSSDSLSG